MSRLSIQDVHFSRGGRPILAGITLDHEAGGVLTLLGPSGSGKTTLLWLLASLLTPDHGRIAFEGDGDHRFGFVFQDGGLWEHLKVRSHLEIVLRGRGIPRAESAARVARALAETGLVTLADRRPGELSGGERQRLALARALVVEPRWLFLDEPTSQLDGPARQDMIELLEPRLRGTNAGVILATHQIDLAMRLSDRIAVIMDGRIAQVGSPAEVYEQPVSLPVARLLGPAFEVGEGIGARIVRPRELAFTPDPAGPFTIRGCHCAGDHWELQAGDGRRNVLVAHDGPVDPGATGRVTRRGGGVL